MGPDGFHEQRGRHRSRDAVQPGGLRPGHRARGVECPRREPPASATRACWAPAAPKRSADSFAGAQPARIAPRPRTAHVQLRPGGRCPGQEQERSAVSVSTRSGSRDCRGGHARALPRLPARPARRRARSSGMRAARNANASCSSARARFAPRQKCGPAPNVSGLARSRSAAMSSSSGASSPPGRGWPRPRRRRPACPRGTRTSRYSMSSSAIRAVNGVIGSKRSTSSAAAAASERVVARARATGRGARRTGGCRGRAGPGSCRRRRRGPR